MMFRIGLMEFFLLCWYIFGFSRQNLQLLALLDLDWPEVLACSGGWRSWCAGTTWRWGCTPPAEFSCHEYGIYSPYLFVAKLDGRSSFDEHPVRLMSLDFSGRTTHLPRRGSRTGSSSSGRFSISNGVPLLTLLNKNTNNLCSKFENLRRKICKNDHLTSQSPPWSSSGLAGWSGDSCHICSWSTLYPAQWARQLMIL